MAGIPVRYYHLRILDCAVLFLFASSVALHAYEAFTGLQSVLV